MTTWTRATLTRETMARQGLASRRPINVTEELNVVGYRRVWTNTTASGETASDENDCQSFSDDTNNSFAPIGETDKSGPSWTYTAQPDEAVDLCTKERRLYCFGGEFWLDGA